jgi:hypothetical protein
MSALLTRVFVIFLLILGSCTPKGQTELSKALQAAVKDNKISARKKEIILSEYAVIRKDDKQKASEYVLKVLNVIKMGGDSSHIDVVRRQVLRTKTNV